ncbi:hypothetical protein COB11_04500 [Candidatus Aerophobetes bacterium]|uniref:Lantibiotic biosynthesis protein dehydration domain-containing protein n=1 Tax=Aerophobetes bacterium TaxID=2030807 RepID=A0A2A4YHL7_UNCAE|nr:MAG: hypothetical protein COB11_04500 [Candidatus Aerophobetes bacterium]
MSTQAVTEGLAFPVDPRVEVDSDKDDTLGRKNAIASVATAALDKSAPRAAPEKSMFSTFSESFTWGVSSVVKSFSSVFKKEFPFDKLITRAEQLFKDRKSIQAERLVDKDLKGFCKDHLKGPYVNDASSQALFQKLRKVILDIEYRTSPEEILKVKTELCHRVVQNFTEMQEEILTRASRDFQKPDFMTKFGIAEGDSIASIELLGDETHNHGRIPARIRFASGAEVIYKPRSMHVEHTLYNSESGVCTGAGLGSYHVMCEDDELGEYGYSEFLHNTEEANTFSTPEELSEYYQKLSKLESIAQELGITDLHLMNVIVKDKIPYIIDAEVYLNPTQIDLPFQTSLFCQKFGVAFNFDLGMPDGSTRGNNRLWFTKELGSKFKYPKRNLTEEELKKAGVDFTDIRTLTSLTEAEQEICKNAKSSLAERPGRFVPVSTKVLKDSLNYINPHSKKSISDFIVSQIKPDLALYGFKIIVPHEHFAELLEEDYLNHDVPTFTFDSRRNVVLCKGQVIAGIPRK